MYTSGYRLLLPTPLLEIITALPSWINWLVFLSCIFALIALLLAPKIKTLTMWVLGCLLFWIVQDISHFSPYMYMYCFTLLICMVCSAHQDIGLNALRIMVAGVYFWAGFHKLNITFITHIFPWFIKPIHEFSLEESNSLDLLFGVVVLITPLFEALIGILLLFPRYWKIATIMAFIMLLTILYCLGPFGHQWGRTVWPWNIFLFLLECRLFWKPSHAAYTEKSLFHLRLSQASIVSMALFLFAPILAIYNPGYSYPGFKLYSGNITMGEVVLPSKETLSAAPDYIKDIALPHRIINLIEWCEYEGNMLYPVVSIYKRGAQGICPYLDNPGEATLRITEPSPFYSLHKQVVEMPLCN